jgi:FkbM family methyltransferase
VPLPDSLAPLKSLRSIPWVNRLGRLLLRSSHRAWASPVIRQLQLRWRVHGEVSLHVHGISVTLYSAGDDGIVDVLYYAPAEYREYLDLEVFLELARRASTVLDIGAHTGLYSILAARVCPTGRILAFEPYAVNADRLRYNLALNRAVNVDVREVVVGAEDGTTAFAIPEYPRICDVASADFGFTQRHYRRWLSYKSVTLPMRTTDAVVRESRLNGVDLLKIDVENHELEVLRGAAWTIAQFRPVILVESFSDDERRQFFQHELAPLGYKSYQTSPGGLREAPGLEPVTSSSNFFLTATGGSLG